MSLLLSSTGAAASSSSSAESEKRAARDEPLREVECIRPAREGDGAGAGDGDGDGGFDRWLSGLSSRVGAGRSWVYVVGGGRDGEAVVAVSQGRSALAGVGAWRRGTRAKRTAEDGQLDHDDGGFVAERTRRRIRQVRSTGRDCVCN